MRGTGFIATAVLALVSGCAIFDPPPARLSGVARPIRPVLDTGKTLTVLRDIAWYGPYPPQRGVRLRVGRYTLEAEDADYWYFRSPVPVEVSTLAQVRITRVSNVDGGLMLSKHFNAVPAAAYIDDVAERKVMVFELGGDFRTMEDSYWKKNF